MGSASATTRAINNPFWWGGGARGFGGKRDPYHRKRACTITAWESAPYIPFDDSAPPDEEYFRALRRVSRYQIIWGGNFFLDKIAAPASCMIVWDKKRRGMDQADCEIAWTNLPGQNRLFEFRWNGMLQQDPKHKEERIHPTQKPVALYRWLLANYARPGMKILDTHAGSASSLVACAQAGLDAWGYEISEHYFRVASERVAAARAQVTVEQLLSRPEPEQEQIGMAL